MQIYGNVNVCINYELEPVGWYLAICKDGSLYNIYFGGPSSVDTSYYDVAAIILEMAIEVRPYNMRVQT